MRRAEPLGFKRMGIAKANGEYIEAMTVPSGWPDVDEDFLRERAAAMISVATQIVGVADSWKRQQSTISGGGIWAGAGADIGSASIRARIEEIAGLYLHVKKAAAWYSLAADVIFEAKVLINENLTSAQEYFHTIRSSPTLTPAEKEDAIQTWVLTRKALNRAIVAGATTNIPPFAAWHPPPPPIRTPAPATRPAGAPAAAPRGKTAVDHSPSQRPLLAAQILALRYRPNTVWTTQLQDRPRRISRAQRSILCGQATPATRPLAWAPVGKLHLQLVARLRRSAVPHHLHQRRAARHPTLPQLL